MAFTSPASGTTSTPRAEVGMVFQLFNLFPHLTVLENITLAQRIVRKRPREEAEQVRYGTAPACWYP